MDKKTLLEYESMAKLRLNDDEQDWAVNAISTLEDSFRELSSIDTKNADPLISVLDLKNVLREDVAEKVISRDSLLSGAPAEYDGYFQVPKTLD